jgi:hypothetical protein
LDEGLMAGGGGLTDSGGVTAEEAHPLISNFEGGLAETPPLDP